MQIAPRPRYNKAMPISDIILQLPSTIARLFGGWFGQEFWLTRMIFVRALGAIYLVAFGGPVSNEGPGWITWVIARPAIFATSKSRQC